MPYYIQIADERMAVIMRGNEGTYSVDVFFIDGEEINSC